MPRRFVPLAIVSIVAACNPAQKADTAPTTDTTPAAPVATAPTGASVAAAFRCTDSTQVFALFRADSAGKPEVALAIGDERLHLPQLVAASGARYGDSATTFWNKGDEAELTRAGKSVTCKVEK